MHGEEVKSFLRFLTQAPTAWHAVEALCGRLSAAGWQRVDEGAHWELTPGGRYYVTRNGSSLIAFALPKSVPENFMIAAAHSDSPTFKIKAVPELEAVGHYTRLDTEPYGGMIMSTWLDRPLSVAGRLVVRDGARFSTRLVSCRRDLCVIPNVAIHMNRDVNAGYSWKPNIDLLPLWGSRDASGGFLRAVAEEAGVDADAVAGYDLYLVNRVPGCVWGVEEAYLSAGRLDDLECAWSLVEAIADSQAQGHVNVCCVFDNEEVGSGTRQGADSTFLSGTLSRVAAGLGCDGEEAARLLAGSMMVSADNAHATHPNHPEYSDPVNRVWMNEGVVIKHNARQKYCTDAVSSAIYSEICRRADVPVQHYANRSDLPGGGTLGNISGSHVSIPAIDIGLAQLAMHSAWETAGALDLPMLVRAMKTWYATGLSLQADGDYALS